MHNWLVQGIPTWDTCTPRGAFAYLKRYIYCTAAKNQIWDIKTESSVVVTNIQTFY